MSASAATRNLGKSVVTPGKARMFITSATEAGRNSLYEYEAGQVARQYDIPVPRYGLAENETQAMALARGIGFPLVMKVVSKDFLHKSDVGGVKLGIENLSEVRAAYRDIIRNAKRAKKDAMIRGVLVQRMAPKTYEFVVGASRRPQSGPKVMFGIGGVFVEIYKDIAYRTAPVSEEQSLEMINEIRGASLLNGLRGGKPLDKASAAKVIRSVGNMILENEEIESVNINPLFIYHKGSTAVDVRIIIRQVERQKGLFYRVPFA